MFCVTVSVIRIQVFRVVPTSFKDVAKTTACIASSSDNAEVTHACSRTVKIILLQLVICEMIFVVLYKSDLSCRDVIPPSPIMLEFGIFNSRCNTVQQVDNILWN